MNNNAIRIGLAGAGSVAFGTACVLLQNGHCPMLWSPSGKRTKELSAGKTITASKSIEGEFKPATASDARQLAADNDVLMLVVPGYAHKHVMDALIPHIRPRHTVIISSHASLGALYLTRELARRDVSVPVIAWGTTLTTGRQGDLCSVQVNTVRSQIDFCVLPSSRTDKAQGLCESLFGQRFVARDGLLAISLSNLNPQNHMGIALGNISRMERGEAWSQGQNVTPAIGALLESLDLERLAIADQLGLTVRTIFEHFHLSFHVPVASISEMNQEMHAQGNGGTGPATADSRYVTEDVPYGLVVTAKLGRLAGKPAPLHEAGIALFSAMYRRDFTSENELLPALELDNYSLDELRDACFSGRLSEACVTG
ncbi:MAG: NAD/NADP octopine/nopaline dehydrogenase family protein [Granulosicoccus sp.]